MSSVPPPPPPAPMAHVEGPSISVEEAEQFKNVKPELTGIGGWLILVATGQALGLLRTLASAGEYYSTVGRRLFEKFPAVAYGELGLNVLTFILMVYTTILFFAKSRRFPKFFILQWLSMIVLPLIDVLWAALTVSFYTSKSFSAFLTIDPRDGTRIIATAIFGSIWIAYVLRSRRVANTFIE